MKIQNQLGSSIVAIRTDHGREFDNEVQFGAYCDAQGITHNFSAPRTPQSNGVVERKNRTLQEMSRTMLNEQSIPQKFWCNAVDMSTYLLNRILIRPILGKTPYEIFRGRKPSLEYFKVFGMEELLNVIFDESPPPTKLSPLVDDDVGEEEAIENNTKDFIFGSTCQNLCDDVAKIMHDEFEMSMMGELNFFLGLQIKQMEDGIFFNQSKYIKDMLKKSGLEDSKPTKTPMSTEIKLTKDDETDSVDNTKYQGMISSLLYLTASRPDIMFSVCLCARFQENPTTTHLEAVKRILGKLPT
ncbi:retrovirus-related pol polyprotein from transposon TNT 1-94 [Tanacetum coccineum]